VFIVTDYVEHGVMGIPVYIPITINVLKGFVNGRETDFKDWTQEVTQYGAGLQNKRIQPCQGQYSINLLLNMFYDCFTFY